jgi:hypothetical protein
MRPCDDYLTERTPGKRMGGSSRSFKDTQNDTHVKAPEPQRESPELAEQGKRLFETLRTRVADTEEQEEYKAFTASFEVSLTVSPEQRKVCSAKILCRTFSLTSGPGFTRYWSGS